MKTEEFERQDGSKGTKHKLEAGDKVVAKYSSPKKNEGGKYDNYSLGVTAEGNDEMVYIQLTRGQAEKLMEAGDITGKTIEAYSYENKYGEQIGVKVL